MNSNGSPETKDAAQGIGQRLAHLLKEDPFHLTEVDQGKFGDVWKQAGQRSIVVSPHLRVAGFLALDPTLFIADCRLGTLGLVFELGEDVAESARTIIDRATYLRHLLVMDAGVDARPQLRPYTVECVLVVPSRQAGDPLNDVFRSTARDTAFWHAIGVNVLVWGAADRPAPATVRRAFSWLLTATESWLTDPDPVRPEKRLTGVDLANYRLPGRRTLTLAPGASIHLLHGQNGTGKSSLAEALELSVTGSVTRLKKKQVENFAEVIRNRRSPQQPARIVLRFDRGPAWTSDVLPQGVNAPLRPEIRVSSFRLDQDAMDDLTRESAERRAEIFLESFFPQDQGLNAALEQARTGLENIARTLSPDIQVTLQSLSADEKAEKIPVRFSWLEAGRAPTREECQDCQGLSNDALQALRALSPDIGTYLDTPQFESVSHFEEIFKKFNDAMVWLQGRAGTLLESIAAGRRCLNEELVRNWRSAASASAVQERIAILEKWTYHCALADLAEKHWQLSKTLSEAAQAGWSLHAAPPDTLFANAAKAAGSLTALEALRTEFADERQRLSDELGKSTHDGETTTTQPASQPHLTGLQMRALDAAGEALGKAETASGEPESLGQLLHRAFSTNAMPVFAGISIGGSDTWAQQLGSKLEAVEKTLSILNDPSFAAPAARREGLKAALSVGKTYQVAAGKVKNAFLNKLRNERFNEALNELMALCTPARWAYEDVAVTRGVSAGKETLQLEITGVKDSRADLLLNTAELNVFTVALYLLSAVRIENGLGLLLFDDPLQNMDELTVTTVARGLAKVATLYKDWQMVFLFHGEDDLERFRQEIPAAVYLLPWLAPSAGPSDEVPIEAEKLKSTFDSELQNLASVIKSRP